MPVTLQNFYGSTVEEFMQDANATYGVGTLGETRCNVQCPWDSDGDGKITKATMTLTITSVTAHWAGSRTTQPDPANRRAIAQVEAANMAHEQKHIDTYQSTFKARKSDAEKKLTGKTGADVDAAVATMNAALKAACETLHSTEGFISVDRSGGMMRIDVSPQGPGGCG